MLGNEETSNRYCHWQPVGLMCDGSGLTADMSYFFQPSNFILNGEYPFGWSADWSTDRSMNWLGDSRGKKYANSRVRLLFTCCFFVSTHHLLQVAHLLPYFQLTSLQICNFVSVFPIASRYRNWKTIPSKEQRKHVCFESGFGSNWSYVKQNILTSLPPVSRKQQMAWPRGQIIVDDAINFRQTKRSQGSVILMSSVDSILNGSKFLLDMMRSRKTDCDHMNQSLME